MPQIMCPNCGMTINMKNRKEIDFNLIKRATKIEPRTFTELLHITKLSRKTLSLRLKEMCQEGTLAKDAGVYKLNGASKFENNGRNLAKGFSRVFNDKRMRTGLMLIAFLLCSSVSGYVLATFLTVKETYQQPVIIGDFAMALDVNNVKDLYAWQAVITFDSSELEVLKTTPGGFVGAEFPLFMNATDIGEGTLLLGGTILNGDTPESGSGRLANILFGYYTNEYMEPEIVLDQERFETYLLYSNDGSLICDQDLTMLKLTIIGD